MIQFGKLVSNKTSQQDYNKQLHKLNKAVKLLSSLYNKQINDVIQLYNTCHRFFERILQAAIKYPNILKLKEFRQLYDIVATASITVANGRKDLLLRVAKEYNYTLVDLIENYDKIKKEAIYLAKAMSIKEKPEIKIPGVDIRFGYFLLFNHIKKPYKEYYEKLIHEKEKLDKAILRIIKEYKKLYKIKVPEIIKKLGFTIITPRIEITKNEHEINVDYYLLAEHEDKDVSLEINENGVKLWRHGVSWNAEYVAKIITERLNGYIMLELRYFVYNEKYKFYSYKYDYALINCKKLIYRVSENDFKNLVEIDCIIHKCALFKIKKITDKSVWLKPVDMFKILNGEVMP